MTRKAKPLTPATELYQIAKERLPLVEPGGSARFALPESRYWRWAGRDAVNGAAAHVWGRGAYTMDSRSEPGQLVVSRLDLTPSFLST